MTPTLTPKVTLNMTFDDWAALCTFHSYLLSQIIRLRRIAWADWNGFFDEFSEDGSDDTRRNHSTRLDPSGLHRVLSVLICFNPDGSRLMK